MGHLLADYVKLSDAPRKIFGDRGYVGVLIGLGVSVQPVRCPT